MANIKPIVKYGLCCGCGTCAGICPTNAITMTITKQGIYEPSIEEDKCINCNKCVESCPGHSVDFKNLRLQIFGTPPTNHYVGNFLKVYIGHSNDRKLGYDSSSGGLATQLLIFALEKGMIDGALVTRMQKENPTRPETFLARTKEEVISASKSKYCPVAANESLKTILKEKGRYASVGLPCHIHGLRKAEKISRSLNDKIVLHIGLLCSHMTSFQGMEFLLKKLGIKMNDVTNIAYRGKGWPGSMTIETRDGSVKEIPLFGSWKSYWPIFSSFFFTPYRCTMCPDQAAELADISLGDAWLPELKSEKIGESIIITRTKRGEEILQLAKMAKVISIVPVSVKKVEQSQAVNLTFKKKDLPNRLFLLGSLGKETPTFNLESKNTVSTASTLRSVFVYCGIITSANESIRKILVHVPFPLFRAYYGIYKFMSYM